ncbi:hypothetical protein ADG881_1888 [Alcanivorax sp. DG881]|nr:hypothetical protein ADG881_1888 [Alcanivorax sp. DG881]
MKSILNGVIYLPDKEVKGRAYYCWAVSVRSVVREASCRAQCANTPRPR